MKFVVKEKQMRRDTIMRQMARCSLGYQVRERGFFRMLRVVFLSFVMLLCAAPSLHAQFTNTHYDEDNYIFYYENGSSGNPGKAQDAFVINSRGDVLQKWTGGDVISPEGAPGYLLETGLLLRGIEAIDNSGDVFQVGAYGILQMVDKNGTVVWEYNGCSTTNDPANGIRPYCLHHDVEPLPNGNILASVHVVYTEDDAEAELGFTRTGQGKLTMEEIWEIQPDLVNGSAEVVWKWRFVDHLVQDANAGLPNFGNVSNPGLFDINCINSMSVDNLRQNGNHFNMNGISYNPVRGHILFSSMKSNEVYIIDHNLTTEEAATSTGDFMWRWGNPKNYDYGGGSQATYSSWKWTKGQHDPRWIVDANGDPTGNITIHNNHSVTNPKPPGGILEGWTECFELEPPYDGSGEYTRTANQPHGPASPTILAEYNPDLPYFSDGFASGAQKLPNGHVFSGSATKFTLLEHDENGNIVWYFDCRTLTPGGGQFWKPLKYPVDYAGFVALGITAGTIYNVTFDLDGKGSRTGGGGLTQDVVQGSTAIEPTITANTGYTFTGWDVALDTVTSDLTVTARYTVMAYTVTYDALDAESGTSPLDQQKTHNVDLTLATNTGNLEKSGFLFVGWNTASDGSGMPYAEGGTYSDNADVTLYPEWAAQSTYTVTFVVGANGTHTGGGELIQTVADGGAAIAPEITANAGYTFTGWDVAFDTVSADLTVTAQYSTTNSTYTLTVNNGTGSGSYEEGQVVDIGATILANYHFVNWADDSAVLADAGSATTTVTMPAAAVTVTANTAIDTYTVTFSEGTNGTRTDGGALVQTVNHGSPATAPEITANAGYTFTGWDVAFDTVSADLTVTAQYTSNTGGGGGGGGSGGGGGGCTIGASPIGSLMPLLLLLVSTVAIRIRTTYNHW